MRLAAIIMICAALALPVARGSAAPSNHGLGVAPAKLPAGTVGKPYLVSVTITGGLPDAQLITCVGTNGGEYGFDKLPKGVDQNQVGPRELRISGTPTETGKFVIDICVTDGKLEGFRKIYEFTIAGEAAAEKPEVSSAISSPLKNIEADELAKFAITVHNGSSVPAKTVRVRVEAIGLDAIGADHGRCAELTPTRYDCTLGALAPRASTAIGVVVRAGKPGSKIVLSSEVLDPKSRLGRKSMFSLPVIAVADLEVTAESEPPTGPGKPIVWTIVVLNKGPDTVRGFVSGTAPQGIVLRSATASGATCSTHLSLGLLCEFRDLAEGDRVKVTLRGRPQNAERTVVSEFKVAADSLARDPLMVNNRASTTTRTR